MTTFTESWKTLRLALTRAASAEVTQRARTALTRDLPALLLEVGVLAPVELNSVGARLADELVQVVRVCEGERNRLRGRGARRPLALKLSVDRVAGALAPLDAALARSAAALRRSDPRLAAVAAATSAAAQQTPSSATQPSPAPATWMSGTAIRSDGAPSARECRALARSLRAALGEAARAARSIQSALHHAASNERDASPAAIAGAIEQTHTLAAWLRQVCERDACPLLRHLS